MYTFVVLNYGVFATTVVAVSAIINSFIARKSVFKRLHYSTAECRQICCKFLLLLLLYYYVFYCNLKFGVEMIELCNCMLSGLAKVLWAYSIILTEFFVVAFYTSLMVSLVIVMKSLSFSSSMCSFSPSIH